ncbi:hypothetical protein FS749_016095 [Ceratobasidium sp. UAMH 11750]|nr:hypothetical protein FS749_016095 [Ceratobasidium sp. UAMH 11750]
MPIILVLGSIEFTFHLDFHLARSMFNLAHIIFAISTLKYLIPTFMSYDLPTYLEAAAVDASVRAAHFVTYAGLGRSRLQLPVNAFLPAPEALQTSREYLSKRFITPTPLLATESAPTPGLWLHRETFNESILWTGDGYAARLIPSAYVFQTEFYMRGAGLFPRVDTCIPPTLGTCPAGPSSDAPTITPSTLPAYRPNLALLDELEGPTELIVYEPPPHSDEFALSLNVLSDEPYVIYVRACLVGLLAIRCIAFIIIICIKFILRQVLRFARSIFNLTHILFMSSCSMAKHLLTNVLGTSANIWGKSWRPVLEAYIPYATRTQIPPIAQPIEAEMPVPVASSRKKNKKRKSKARKKSRRASGW